MVINTAKSRAAFMVPKTQGHNVCQRKLISRVSLSTELQFEILLPCLFEAALFGSNLTTSSSAVWIQINTTVEYIVDIKVNDPESFWNNRNGRIETFRDRSGSGNFSILISNVQRSDLGLYRCELYKDNNCSLGYREISLSLVEFSLLNWQLIVAGGGGGGFLLLCLITVCVYTWMKRESDHCAMRPGHNVCQRKLISRVGLSTELQFEILLPCLFEAALFGSNLTTSSSAVWTQINTTVEYIVDIKVNDPESFWNNRNGRIETFRDRSGSGNFSILISNVQRSDLGLYRCELYKDNNCSLGYREISLSLVEFSLLNWQLIVAGGGGGGFLLLCLITVCVYYTWTKRETGDEITYASVTHKPHNCHDSKGETGDEITYASVSHKPHNCHDSEVLVNSKPINGSASEHVSSETVLYASVKNRDKT
ncbi:hypothetical protein DPX16_22520 [Anabarilius grahami]|uniref:Ig-like domain-containing protein n=1 Tax=Anabarilius grahami TaxID=495550 RepID=A0A3N0YZX1_ANAGA|nr:hypothetical protein DPX16_22520 [Anabarilius grahami]